MSSDEGKTIAQIDNEAIERYNKLMEENMDREARLVRHREWRGNKLPPFSIEHMPLERQRLSGTGMTAEDRVLRRQWLKDQELSHNEPRFIAELYPRNPIRRIYGKPWDVIFTALKPIIGERRAAAGRYFVPRVALAVTFLYATYYHMKYNPQSWSSKHGWNIYSNKPTLLPEGVTYELKKDDDFYDRGFKERKALLNDR